MRTRVILLMVVLGIVLAISASAQQSRYKVIDVGQVDSYSTVKAYQINNQNQTLATGVSGGARYLLTMDTGKQVVSASALDSKIATIDSCSESGTLTGKTAAGNIYAWNKQTGLHEFDLLPNNEYAVVTSVNDSGQVLFHDTVGNHATSYIWNSGNNSLTTIQQSPDWLSCIGVAINNSGKVAGYTEVSNGVVDYWHNAFAWDSVNGFTELTGQYSMALGVNDSGIVCGFSSDSLGYDAAAIWDTAGNRTNLFTSHYVNNSYATAANNAGQVAGYISYFAQEPGRAYLWENGDWHDLYAETGYSWEPCNALDINDSGLILATAMHNGLETQVVLIPVAEPAAMASLILGLCGVSGAILRRRKNT